MKQIFSKIKAWFVDHYHILFKSAADNHLRIQAMQKSGGASCIKNADGTYSCSVHFDSYTELKKYQKKLRRITVSLSSAVAMMLIAVIVAPYVYNPNKSAAASFQWVQNSWVGGINASTGTTKSGWDKFSATSDIAQINTSATPSSDHLANSVTLVKSTPTSIAQTNDTDLGAWTATGDGTYVSGTGSTAKINLRKPNLAACTGTPATECVATSSCTSGTCKKAGGQTCSSGTECASGACSGSPLVCTIPCDANTTCGTSCSYNGDMYATIQIGTQCWFAENLRTTKKPDGTDITALAYCNAAGCGSPWGRLYKWSTAMNIAATYDTALWNGVTATGAKIQGICPTGWHIPSDYNASATDDMQKLVNFAGGDGAAGNALKQIGNTSPNGWASPNADNCSDPSCTDQVSCIGTSHYDDYEEADVCDSGCCASWKGAATNNTSFTAMPAGYWNGGGFFDRPNDANFWSSSEVSAGYAWSRLLYGSYSGVDRSGDFGKTFGFSVRCIKD